MDLKNNLTLAQSLAPAARTASANGSSVDLQGAENALVIVECGALTDGTHTPSVQESDASGSGFTNVAAGDLIGALAACSANAVQAVEYKGAKRYIRVVMTVAGATTGAVSSAVVARGGLRHVGTAV
jgi:hypothetical protein